LPMIPRAGSPSYDLKCVEISGCELRLIVKHFLEVRHVPVTSDRVTMKTAADVIVHPAGGHFAQREQSHVERVFARISLGITRIKSRQEIQRDRPRKFWSITESGFFWVVTAIKLLVSGLQNRRVDLAFACRARFRRTGDRRSLRFAQRCNDLAALLDN